MQKISSLNNIETRRPFSVALSLLILGGMCLGTTPVIVKSISFAPEVSAFYRVLLAAPAFLLISLFVQSGDRTASRRPPKVLYAVTAVLFAADLGVMHLAIRMTDVAIATLFTNCAPFAVGVLGLIGLSDRPSSRFWIALAVALLGIGLLIGFKQLGGGRIEGDLLALSAAMLYGGYIVCVKKLRAAGATSTSIMLVVTSVSAVILFPVFWVSGHPLPSDLQTWLLLLGLVGIGQIAGQGLVAIALSDLPASLGSLVLLVQPVVAAVLSWILLGEHLSLMQIVGIAFVLLAIAVASAR